MWKSTIDTQNNWLFNSTSSSVDHLWEMIQDGSMLEPAFLDDSTTQYLAQKALYLQLIPYAWQVHGDHAFLIPSGHDCNYVEGPVDWMRPEQQADVTFCVDDVQYYLFQPAGPAAHYVGGGGHLGPGTYTQYPLSPVNGYDQLTNDNHPWADVTAAFIVSR
jgi:hypothetical protein